MPNLALDDVPVGKDENSNNDDDEFNVSLAKMEEEIKPKIVNLLISLNKNYSKLQKYQVEKLEFLILQVASQRLILKIYVKNP